MNVLARILTAAALALIPFAQAQALDRVLSSPRIKDNGDIRLSDDLKLGRFLDGKTVLTPDSLSIQGPGSTGPIDDMTTKGPGALLSVSQAKRAERTYYAEDFCTSSQIASDASSCLATGMNTVKALGGGTLRIGPKGYPIFGADITVPETVVLAGDFSSGGVKAGLDYTKLPYSLVLGPGRTVRTQRNSGLRHVAIAASNLTVPTSLQGMVSALNAFAGTGLTIGSSSGSFADNTSDVTVEDVFVIGFAKCVDLRWADRTRMRNVFGDCTSGGSFDNMHDVPRFENVHFWPFFSANGPYTTAITPISAVANNGSGLIRVTTSAAHSLAAGNAIDIAGAVGLSSLNGHWTVAAVPSPTTIDLQGSAYAGGYTGGGTVYLSNVRRAGTGFEVTNSEWAVFDKPFAYGYATCVHLGDGALWTEIHLPGCDDFLDPNAQNTNGILIDGTADRNHVTLGYVSSYAHPLTINASTTRAQIISGTSIGATNATAMRVLSGTAIVTGAAFTGGKPIYVGNGAGALTLANVEQGGSPVTYQSAVAPRVTVLGPQSQLAGLNVAAATVPASGPTAVQVRNTDTSGTGAAPNSVAYQFGTATAITGSIEVGTQGADYIGFRFGNNVERMRAALTGATSFTLYPGAGQVMSIGNLGGPINDITALSVNTPVVAPTPGSNLRLSTGSQLPAAATTGFILVPGISGPPTGAPAGGGGGAVPLAVDVTSSKVCAYIGSAWKCATLQ